MPQHDWTNDAGWDGFHLPWIMHAAVNVNLEETYMRAAADAYLT
jgi:hypothetical protein